MRVRTILLLFFLFFAAFWSLSRKAALLNAYSKFLGIYSILHGKLYLQKTMQHMWGSFFTRGQILDGDYFYAGMALKIAVFDVHDPRHIIRLREIPVQGTVHYMVRDKNFIYAAAGDDGILILDITQKNNPTLVSSLQDKNYARNVGVLDGFAYVAEQEKGVGVVDVRNKQKPKRVRTVKAGIVNFVKVQDGKAYLSDAIEGFVILDLSHPEKPVVLSRLKLPSENHPDYQPVDPPPYDVALAGDIAYVANGYKGIAVINIKNPRKPALVKNFRTKNFCHNITVKNRFAFVTVQPGTILMLDIKNPENPVEVKEVPGFGGYSPFAFSGKRAVFQKERTSFSIVDAADMTSPKILGTYQSPGSGQGITISSKTLYLSDGSEGLKIFSLENPEKPRLSGTLNTTAFAHRTAVFFPYAFIADGLGGVVAANVAHPEKAKYITSYNFQQHPWDIAVRKNISYLATGSVGLTVYDISNVSSPRLLSSVKIPNDYVTALDIENHTAAVGGLVSGLYFFDVANARKPALKYKIFDQVSDVLMKEEKVYVSNPLGFIKALQFKGKPVFLTSAYTGGKPMGLYLNGNKLYCADAEKGLLEYDVSAPSSLKFLRRYPLKGNAYGVAVYKKLAYVADGEKELAVVNLSTGNASYWHEDF